MSFPAPTPNEPCGQITCTPPSGAFFPGGTTPVECSDVDGATCSFDVTVVDVEAPSCTVVLTPTPLWPPNNKLIEVTAAVTTNDNCPGTTFELLDITSDETSSGVLRKQGLDIVDADLGTADVKFRLRAQRSEGGDGRTYRIRYRATDVGGNSAVCTATVEVPRDLDD